ARICDEAGFSHADLSGNARLAFGQVYIETRSPENPFRQKREVRSIFAPKAARVLRFLLQGPLRGWKVNELAKAAQVSLGWLSAVRQQLLAREWGTEEPAGFRVTKPQAVLAAWEKVDEWQRRTTTRQYSLLASPDTELLAKKVLKT